MVIGHVFNAISVENERGKKGKLIEANCELMFVCFDLYLFPLKL